MTLKLRYKNIQTMIIAEEKPTQVKTPWASQGKYNPLASRPNNAIVPLPTLSTSPALGKCQVWKALKSCQKNPRK